jgi:hypothetical protein
MAVLELLAAALLECMALGLPEIQEPQERQTMVLVAVAVVLETVVVATEAPV